jgi:hypothetical protein
MRSITVPTSSQRWSARQRRPHRTVRFATRCDYLEGRQLLSISQPSLAEGALPSPPAPAAQLPASADARNVSLSSNSSVAAALGSPVGVSSSQVGFLLDELAYSPVSPSAGIVATSAAPSANSTVNGIAVDLTLTNLSVTVLNPSMTSTTAAIIDTQVDSDAYLIPSTPDLLDDHLGVSTATLIPHSSANNVGASNSGGMGSPVSTRGRSTVSNRGQSSLQELTIYPESSPADESDEPSEAGVPTGAQQSQPAPPGERAPAPANAPQPAPPAGKAPAPETAPQPTPPAGKAPAPATTPQAAPPGEQAPEPETADSRSLPTSDSDIDAALDVTDARVFTRSRVGGASRPDVSHFDSSRSLSALFGVAMIASSGYVVLHGADRYRPLGRWVPRWSGAERPRGRKTATPSS